jgi:Transcription factor Tfb2 (p52) C-terminal domain
MEKNRLRATPGTLYLDIGPTQFKDIIQYASDFGYVLWSSEPKKMIVLSSQGHEHVRNWLKNKSQ